MSSTTGCSCRRHWDVHPAGPEGDAVGVSALRNEPATGSKLNSRHSMGPFHIGTRRDSLKQFAACLLREDLVAVVASRSRDEVNLLRLASGDLHVPPGLSAK